MPTIRTQHLLKLYFDNKTAIKKAELFEWITKPKKRKELSLLFGEAWPNCQTDTTMPNEMSDEIITSFFTQETTPEIPEKSAPVIRFYPKREWCKLNVTAACIMLLISTIYLFITKTTNTPIVRNNLLKQQLINNMKQGGQWLWWQAIGKTN